MFYSEFNCMGPTSKPPRLSILEGDRGESVIMIDLIEKLEQCVKGVMDAAKHINDIYIDTLVT